MSGLKWKLGESRTGDGLEVLTLREGGAYACANFTLGRMAKR
jgi:hypothetical protein